MQVTALSGTTVAQLDQDEFLHMVESGKSIRDLKQLLSAQVGCSRFQQRLFSDEIELLDDMPLRPLPTVLLVILPFCVSDEIAEEELLRSCKENNIIALERLLQKPLDPNGGGLFVAAKRGHLEVVRLLLEAGAQTDAHAANRNGATALMIAAENGHLDVMQLLLKAGADKDSATAGGATALMLAAQNGHSEVVRVLLEAGADKEAATTAEPAGQTALFAASLNGHLEVVRLLLEAGADKDAATTDGQTALFAASLNHDPDVLRLLLEAGAGKDAATREEQTALFGGDLDVQDLLSRRGSFTAKCCSVS